jgi:enoyl-CoA hydratase
VQLETMYSTVEDGVATVVLNRPDVLNCADERWIRDFQTILDDLRARAELRVVVIRGAGRAFCTGIDLTALSEGRISASFFRGWENTLRRLELMDAVVVAAVHSHCVGGGLQLALAADLRIAREDARFGITAVKEGIVPGLGMWRIARYAGRGRASRLALTADVVDARTAYAWGLVDYVVDAEQYEARLSQLTERLLTMAWTSTRLTKKLIVRSHDPSFEEILELFTEYQRMSIDSAEHQAAMAERRSRRVARS